MDKKHGYYSADDKEVSLPETDWKSILPPQIYHIAREKGTERPLRKMALPPSGLRYCINSVSIEFEKKETKANE